MSEQFDVILGGLDTEVDVTIADSTGVDPSVLLALRGEKGDKGDTGAAGQDGADGFSPIATVSKVGDTATISITDLNGTTTANISDGTDGVDGTDGADGYSPTATVTKSGDTATITITDINGTTTATVKDGTQANAFTAEFGTTTYADVKDAYDDDAILICTVDDSGNTVVLQLVYFDATNEIFYFAEPNGDGWYWTELSNANGWDDGTRYLASTDVATQLRDGLMSALDKQKLDGIASGAEVNVQSDWNQSVNTADDYIKNKPTIPTKVSDLSNDSGFITSPNVVYCTCSTAGGTAAKVATIESGSLTSLNEGDQAIVKFTNANSVASPTLQVGTTTAKSIKRYGTTAPSTSAATSWNAGSAILFVYDGTYWQQIGFLNTTYSEISQANITNGSGSSTGLVTGRRAKAAVEAFAPIKDVTVDGTSVLSGTTAAIDLSGKANASHTHTKSEITDFPALAAVATTGNYNSLTDKPAIHNVPSGGSSGQVLSKASGTDYDLAWSTVAAGGTPIPTADTVAEFDSSACMNSSDMSAQDIEDFLADINAQGTPSEYRKLLWSNPSPTSAFNAQDVNLDLSDYDAVDIECKHWSNDDTTSTTRTEIGEIGTISIVSNANGHIAVRDWRVYADRVYIGAGKDLFGTSLTNPSNSACVPYRIYGIKYEKVAPIQVDEQWVQVGATSAQGNLTLTKNISDYRYIAWYLIENQYGAVEGFFYTPTSVFVQYNNTAHSMGINAYNGGRQYAYLNYVNDTTVNVQLSGSRSVAVWLIT